MQPFPMAGPLEEKSKETELMRTRATKTFKAASGWYKALITEILPHFDEAIT